MEPFACCCGLCDADAALQMVHNRWRALFALLNERQGRLYAAEKALQFDHDGARIVARILGLSARTIERGLQELQHGLQPLGPERVRRCGGGRPSSEDTDPALLQALEALLEENTAGDPMCLLKWTHKSSRTLAAALAQQGHDVSHTTVGRLLHELGYSLRGNVKALEGKQHPDRDAQFRYLHEKAKEFVRLQQPVVSVDTKKKEKVGEFANPGQQWTDTDRLVNAYDFPSLVEDIAIPYGAYDEQRNEGFVNVGTSHDTSEFAVASIRQWWHWMGRRAYPQATTVLITADNGGSNRSRNRLWQLGLQRFADDYQLDVTVCHFPTGTSKWNKVEHRLFSFISMNWRGEPLTSYETVIQLISHTTTKQGLRIEAHLDETPYETGIEVSDEELGSVQREGHAFHPDWNYTIRHHGKS
jgi:transposase